MASPLQGSHVGEPRNWNKFIIIPTIEGHSHTGFKLSFHLSVLAAYDLQLMACETLEDPKVVIWGAAIS